MFSLNFMFFCSLIEELCTKKKTIKQVVTLILDMSVILKAQNALKMHTMKEFFKQSWLQN